MDPHEVDRYCPVEELVHLCSVGDDEGVKAMVDRSLTKCGKTATWQQITTCEVGGRGSTSALHTAARNGRASILRIFLEAGVDPEAADDAGCGPLMHTAERGHARAAHVLLRGGANADRLNNFGVSPRSYLEINSWDSPTVRVGKQQILRLLENGLDSLEYEDLIPEPPGEGTQKNQGKEARPSLATTEASTSGLSDFRSGLQGLSDWVSSRLSEVTASFPLSEAGSGRSTSQKRPSTSSETYREPPLTDCVRRNDVAGVRQKLEAARREGGRIYAIQEACNCEESAQDSRIVASPLHVAAMLGHIECLQVLLETGASIEHVTDAGDTLLHTAAGYGQPEAVRYLLEKKADPTARNNFGRSPLDLAKEESFDWPEMRRKKAAITELLGRRAVAEPAEADTVSL